MNLRNASFFFRGLAVLIIASATLWGDSDQNSPLWRKASDPDVAGAVAEAKGSLQLLLKNLSTALTKAVEQGGPVQGVAACQIQALPLTHQTTVESSRRVTGIKRTSLKLRNPANRPDAAEQAALDRVARLIAEGESLPPLLVQEVPASQDQPREIRVYKPLTLATQCLACHGDPTAFSTDLQATLAQRYPQDTATGYVEGDWRGLIRISLQP